MSSTAHRNFWYEWRRRETELQLAIRRAEEFGTPEEADEIYGQILELHEGLMIPAWLWLNLWYENRRSYIRVRNRRRAGHRQVVRAEGWRR